MTTKEMALRSRLDWWINYPEVRSLFDAICSQGGIPQNAGIRYQDMPFNIRDKVFDAVSEWQAEWDDFCG